MRTEEGKKKQAESHAQYDKNNTKRLQCKFNLKTDADGFGATGSSSE